MAVNRPGMSSNNGISIDKQMLEKEGIIYFTVAGVIDAHTYDKMEEEVSRLFDRNCYKVIVDLSGVDYISSAGTGVFIFALSETTNNDGKLVLVGLRPSVKQVFDLLGLTPMFPIARDRAEALTHFGIGSAPAPAPASSPSTSGTRPGIPRPIKKFEF